MRELVLPFEGCEKDFREMLARTNFWLSEMRKLLDVRIEVNVNWHPMGFNGCGFASSANEPLGFCFYSSSINSEDNFEISRVSISFIPSKKIESEIIKIELVKSNDRFNKLLEEKGSEIFYGVKRFFLVIHFVLEINDNIEIGVFENPQTSRKIQDKFPEFKDLQDKLLGLFPNSKIESYFHFLPQPITSNYGLEFIFEKSISEIEFIEKLKIAIPNLQNSYLGWNLRSRESMANMDCVIDINPRHF